MSLYLHIRFAHDMFALFNTGLILLLKNEKSICFACGFFLNKYVTYPHILNGQLPMTKRTRFANVCACRILD